MIQTRKRYPKGTWMKLTSGATLRALMDQWNLSNADVGDAANVSRTFISALVNGRRTSCSPDTAHGIARRLNVPLEVLFMPKAPTGSSRKANTERPAA